MYQRIRDLREDADLTQQAVAALLHISQTTYSRYESGILDIPSAALITLANYYGVSVDYLLGLTSEKTPYQKQAKKSAWQSVPLVGSVLLHICTQNCNIGGTDCHVASLLAMTCVSNTAVLNLYFISVLPP